MKHPNQLDDIIYAESSLPSWHCPRNLGGLRVIIATIHIKLQCIPKDEKWVRQTCEGFGADRTLPMQAISPEVY